MTDPHTQSLEERLFRCWHRGDSIAEARLAIERATGTRPTFEQVHRHFVALSHRF